MNKVLSNFLKKELPKTIDIESLLEKPKHESHGDISLPCFLLAKELKINPIQAAKELEEKLSKKLPKSISKVQATGPFLNFYLNNEQEAREVLESLKKEAFTYQTQNKQKILIEYPSPNTNKALHLGHTRNILIGNTLTKIFRKTGHKVIRTNLNNDRGIAVCKAMLAYKLFGNNTEPKNQKPDEFVESWYVRFGREAEKNPDLEKQAQEMLVKWENEDRETRDLWRKLLSFVYQGYKETFEMYKVRKFDREYNESEIYDKGRDIVEKALKDNVKGFRKEGGGAVFVDLEDKGLGKKYLLRGDGTTLYMTQDIYLANLKEKEFKADRNIFIVAEEQQYHFNVLFEVLDRLGQGGNEKNYHFAYGFVYDKDGKKFSSRKGETIGARSLLLDIIKKAKENLKSKELTKNLSEKELDKRAKIIGYSALSFVFLKANPLNSINFDVEKALSFEGETGPYVLYSYARIQSILRKASYVENFDVDYSLFEEKESQLIKLLKQRNEILKEAEEKYKISAVAHYLIKLAKQFNEVYQSTQILKAENSRRNSLLFLSTLVAKVIKEGLELLDIEVLDEM